MRITGALGAEVGEVAEFGPALAEAEARTVEELMGDLREQVFVGGREVHIAFGELPARLRDELGRYVEENPGSVRHLTLNLTLREMQALANRGLVALRVKEDA